MEDSYSNLNSNIGREMNIVKAKRGQVSYGEAIGILLLETNIPFIPGDVGNATTYCFPVRFKTVKGASIQRIVNEADRSLLKPFIEAGMELVQEGVKAVTGDCGFMAMFQKEMADVLPVPVFMSSLLQVPFISRMLRRGEKVGIICADRAGLRKEHFINVGIDETIPVEVVGMQDEKEFKEAILLERGTLNPFQIESEVIAVVERLVRDHPPIGAILLECSDLPPYSAAVQGATGLPVFDFVTMINFVYSGIVKQKFVGCM